MSDGKRGGMTGKVTLGFVGLGAMGSRMAKRLLDAGYPVVGYNRTPAKARWLVEAGLRLADSPRAAAEGSQAVFSMVSDTAALRAVALGPDGVIAGLGRGATFVEMSTVSPAAIRELGELAAARGAALLDAPVSGSGVTVEEGNLSFMVGGDPAVLERVRPYLLAIGPTVTQVGPLGFGKSMKIAINLALGAQFLAFSETILLADRAGIPRERAVETVLKSALASPMLKYRGPLVLGMPEEPIFNVGLMQKDLELAMELGKSLGVSLPSVALAHEMLTAARGLGLAHFDFAVMFDVLAAMNGLPGSPKPHAEPGP
ncbi:MAG TPA: NAD(P)-dependent oxidoreductase [Candidatus Methylomirabilis sp.]|jgi:3-hydroxyisobutyrate dehydrogenase-like beta-hydroxyacid dehydrogenase